jgi:hypothetical protein
MNYTLTEHAKKVLAEREIPLEWLERVLREPVLREPDPDHASLERRYRPHHRIQWAGAAGGG